MIKVKVHRSYHEGIFGGVEDSYYLFEAEIWQDGKKVAESLIRDNEPREAVDDALMQWLKSLAQEASIELDYDPTDMQRCNRGGCNWVPKACKKYTWGLWPHDNLYPKKAGEKWRP